MSFQPRIGEVISINGMDYVWAENREQPGMIMRKEGTESFVYPLYAADGRNLSRRALKVFLRHYRTPSIVAQLEQLRTIMELQGLQSANRIVLVPQEQTELVSQYRDLMYATVMPWIDGPTWQDIVREKRELSRKQAWTMAKALANTLTLLEQRGMAHCRLTAANILLPHLGPHHQGPADYPIELIDLEHMYHPAWKTKETAHDELWGPYADRFSGTLLLSEILGWVDPAIRQTARERGCFYPQEHHKEGERYKRLLASIYRNWGESLAQLLDLAWVAKSGEQCPSMGEWLTEISEAEKLHESVGVANVPLVQAKSLPTDTKKMLMIEPVARVGTEIDEQRGDSFVPVARQEREGRDQAPFWKGRKLWIGTTVLLGVVLAGSFVFSMWGSEEHAADKTEAAIQQVAGVESLMETASEKSPGAEPEPVPVPGSEPESELEPEPESEADPDPVPVVREPIPVNPASSAKQPALISPPPAVAVAPAAQSASNQLKPGASVSAARPVSQVQAEKHGTKPKPGQQKPPVKKGRPVQSKTAPIFVKLAPVEKAGKWGYIRKGPGFERDQVIIPYQYDHATPFSGGLALVKKEGKFGYINASGQQVIPIQFEYATPFANGKATVKKNGVIGQINQSGTFINNNQQ